MINLIIIILLITIIVLIQNNIRKIKSETELKTDYEQRIKNLIIEHEKDIKIKTETALNRSRYTLKGTISEIFCPFHEGFPYMAADCIFTGKPIDYIIFHNLEAYREGKKTIDDIEIIFAEVKSNHQASLSQIQQAIQKVIQKGNVKFETYKYDERTIEQSKIAIHKAAQEINKIEPLDFSELDKKYDKSKETPEIIEIRKKYPRHRKSWFEEENQILTNKINEGYNIEELSILFGRSKNALEQQLIKIGIDVQDL